MSNVDSHLPLDRMDSYFLAETVKYLYLIFDSSHWANKGRFIFNTEGHLLPFKLPSHKQENSVNKWHVPQFTSDLQNFLLDPVPPRLEKCINPACAITALSFPIETLKIPQDFVFECDTGGICHQKL